MSSWGLIDCIAQSDPTVRIHPGHTVVFSQLSLYSNINRVVSVMSCNHEMLSWLYMYSVDGGVYTVLNYCILHGFSSRRKRRQFMSVKKPALSNVNFAGKRVFIT